METEKNESQVQMTDAEVTAELKKLVGAMSYEDRILFMGKIISEKRKEDGRRKG